MTMRTTELIHKNEQLSKDLNELRERAEALVEDVLSNPENAHLRSLQKDGTFGMSVVRKMFC